MFKIIRIAMIVIPLIIKFNKSRKRLQQMNSR
jgi:hypothetical protein